VQTWVEESVTFPVNIQDDVSMTLAAIELSETKLIFDNTVINNT
jgi:hypothetical protein